MLRVVSVVEGCVVVFRCQRSNVWGFFNHPMSYLHAIPSSASHVWLCETPSTQMPWVCDTKDGEFSLGHIGGVFAQRAHNYYGDYPGNNPENYAPAESCTINSKLKNSNIRCLPWVPGT